MPSLEALQERAAEPFSELLVKYAKASPNIVDGIRRGVAELRAGKTRAWSDIKREAGIG